MFRNLILLIAVAIVVWLVSRIIKNKSQQSNTSLDNNKNSEIKTIVQCQVCQVFIPEDKAIKQDQHAFCSQKHLEQWKENNQ